MSITNQTASSDLITPEPYQPPTVTGLRMHRGGFRDDGPLSGSITFKGKLGEVQLTLSDASCQKVLALLADAAAESVAEVANALRSQFTDAALLPKPPTTKGNER
jgi:hypothetical protein